MTTRCPFYLLVIVVILTIADPQQSSAGSVPVPLTIRFGVEVDPLPFVLDGYILSAWSGAKNLRARILTARVHKPDFLLPSGYTENVIQSSALLIDYFPGDDEFAGWWGAVGIVLWKGSIKKTDINSSLKYSSILLSFDAGYAWHFYENFYLSPWAALHIRCGGDDTLHFSTGQYTVPLVNPEASIKLGWYF